MSSEGGIGEGAMASEGGPDDWGHHDGVLMTSAPLRDMIRLVREPFSGRSLLAHTGLKEELLLDPPSGAWLLGYMDDGEPFLCDDGSDEEHLCKDLFPRELLVSDSGRFAAAKTHSDGEVEIEWLCVLEQRFKYMELDMHIGPLRAAHSWQYAVFDRLRGGVKCFWSLKDVHEICRLSFATASGWIYKSWPTWEKLAAEMGCTAQLLRSRLSVAESGVVRPLDWPSVGSQLLVYLLSRWCFQPKAQGGLAHDGDKAAAQELFRAMLSLVAFGSWAVTLYAGGFVDELADWPVRRDCKGNGAELEVFNGCVCVGQIVSPHLRRTIGIDTIIEKELLFTFFARLARAPVKPGLLMQLAIQVGKQLDEVVMGLEYEIGPHINVDGVVRRTEALDFGRSVFQDERSLIAYIDAGRAKGGAELDISSAVDKARIFGRGLLDGFFAAPDNTGWWGPPKESRRHRMPD